MKLALASGLIEHVPWRCTPARAITAPIRDELDPVPDKGLSNNRDRYFAQSAATRCGVVAPLPAAA